MIEACDALDIIRTKIRWSKSCCTPRAITSSQTLNIRFLILRSAQARLRWCGKPDEGKPSSPVWGGTVGDTGHAVRRRSTCAVKRRERLFPEGTVKRCQGCTHKSTAVSWSGNQPVNRASAESGLREARDSQEDYATAG